MNKKCWRNKTAFLRFLQLRQNSELYKYIILSKKVEQIAADPDPWEEDNYPNNNISEVISEANNLYKQAYSPICKIAHCLSALPGCTAYNYQPEQVSRVYDSLIDTVKTRSWIKTASLYQKTLGVPGCTQGTIGYRKYSIKVIITRTICLLRFETSQADSTLFLARNEHEKNVIQAMKAFNYPGRSLSILKRIYGSEPGYKELPFLLAREVNKVEDWLLTSKVTDFGMPAVYLDSVGFNDNYAYLDNAALNYKNDKIYARELCGL